MSVYGKLLDDNFDILGIDESDTSLVRNPVSISLTYKHDGKLIQFVKVLDTPSQVQAGSLLVAKHGVLIGTKDRKHKSTVAKLLANISESHQQKYISVGFSTKTAHLLPVELIN